MDAELVKIEDLAEKEVTRRGKSAVEMLAEYDDLPGGRARLDLIAGGTPGDVGGDEPGALESLKLPGGDGGSALVGGDGFLRGGRRGAGGGSGGCGRGEDGYVVQPGVFCLAALAVGLGRHGREKCVRAG